MNINDRKAALQGSWSPSHYYLSTCSHLIKLKDENIHISGFSLFYVYIQEQTTCFVFLHVHLKGLPLPFSKCIQ